MKYKWSAGDLVEFIPGNYLFKGYNTSFWLEGAGIIYGIEDDHYVIRVYNLRRTSTKNLATYDIGETMMKLPAKDCDMQECFRSLED